MVKRQLLAAFVSWLNGCAYCEQSHRRTAESFGIDSAMIDVLENGMTSELIPADMRPIFRLAKKLTHSPSRVEKADVDAVLAAGWDETTLFYAVQVCAAFNMMNRVVQGLGIELEERTTKLAAQKLYYQGYEAINGRGADER